MILRMFTTYQLGKPLSQRNFHTLMNQLNYSEDAIIKEVAKRFTDNEEENDSNDSILNEKYYPRVIELIESSKKSTRSSPLL